MPVRPFIETPEDLIVTNKITAINTGVIAQAVRVRGGSITVKPNAKVDVSAMIPLTEEQIDAFAAKGLTFDGEALNDGLPSDAETDFEARQAALSDAEKRLAADQDDLKKAQGQLSIDQGALVKGQQQLAADQADLATRQGDGDKAQKAADGFAKNMATAQANVVAARTALASADDAGKAAAQDALTKAEAAFAKVTA